jgi:hypothetical protein
MLRPRELRVHGAIIWRQFVGGLQFLNRLAEFVQVVQRISQCQVKLGVVGRAFQRDAILRRRLLEHPFIAIRRAPYQVQRHRVAQLFLRELGMLQSSLRTMQIQAGVGQSQMSLAIFRLEPEGSFKIRSRLSTLAEIVQHEPAIHVSSCHSGIALNGTSKGSLCLVQISMVLVNISSQERKRRLLWHDVFIFRSQLQ